MAVVPSQVDALVKKSVTLDASKSKGVGGAAVSYLWSLESKPDTSTAQLNYNNFSTANLWLDVAGTYVFKLVVSSGGTSSEAAYVTVEAVPTGLLAPFATFDASGFRMSDSGMVNGCNFYRSTANFDTFWDFVANATDLNCSLVQVGALPADLQMNGTYLGGTPSTVALNLENLQNSGISGTSRATWFDVNNIASYGYSTSAESILLSEIPTGKTSGTAFIHSVTPAYVQPWTTGTLQYKVEGMLQPTNVPAGWELAQEMSMLVMLQGPTFENGQPGNASVKVFEKTYTADFAETIPLNLNWAQLPVTFANYASYQVTLVHRIAFKRMTE